MIRKCMVSTQETPITPPYSKVRVTFELPSCTWAHRISVCGDFNGWEVGALVMRQERDGIWRATIDLEPNRRYEFRYSLDGAWQTDYHADGWSTNRHGSENSVVDTGLLSEGEVEIMHSPQLRPLNGSGGSSVPLPPRSFEEMMRLPVPVGGQLHEALQQAAERNVSQRAHAVRRAA